MPVYQYLDLSTAHLPEAERALLGAGSDEDTNIGVILRPHPYGAWVHVPFERPDDIAARYDRARAAGFDVLLDLIDYARDHACAWINLDQDGDVEPSLLVFP